jgi:hypothetical protein
VVTSDINCGGNKYCVPLEVSHWLISYWLISYWFIMNLVMSKLLLINNSIMLCNNYIGSHVTLELLVINNEVAHDKIIGVKF